VNISVFPITGSADHTRLPDLLIRDHRPNPQSKLLIRIIRGKNFSIW
jgi:hypothetical protein